MRKYILFDFLYSLIIYFGLLLPKWRITKRELFLRTIFFVYIVGVIYFTLMPIFLPVVGIKIDFNSRINLMPFLDLAIKRSGALKEVFLNILMFVPLGVLVPFVLKKKFVSTILYSICLSLSIEVFQLLSIRNVNITDVTDIITNTMGAIIGYILCLLFRRVANRLMDYIFIDGKLIEVKQLVKPKIIVTILILLLTLRSLLYGRI